MKLKVLGAEGTAITVNTSVDGVERRDTAVIPATIAFTGRSANWKVERRSGQEDFRVEFQVGEKLRLSTTSSGHAAIRGAIVYERNSEKYWAEPVD